MGADEQLRLSRSALSDLLHRFARQLSDRQVVADVHIFGGAALLLDIWPTRKSTLDVDAWLNVTEPRDPEECRGHVVDVVAAVGGGRQDWLDQRGAMFLPEAIDPSTWRVVLSNREVRIRLAPPEVLLAMKLRAGRGRRDFPDADRLLTHLGWSSAALVVEQYSALYPDDPMPERSVRWLSRRLGGARSGC